MSESLPRIQVIAMPVGALLDAAVEACAGETLVIAASAALARSVRERIATDRGAAVTPNLHTFRSLAESFAGPHQLVSPAERRLRIADAVRKYAPGGRVGESCATPGFARYAEDLIRRLQQARVSPSDARRLAPRAPETFRVVAAAYSDYVADLHRLGRADEYDLIEQASAELRRGCAPRYSQLLAAGFVEFTSAQADLLLVAMECTKDRAARVLAPIPAAGRVTSQLLTSLGDRAIPLHPPPVSRKRDSGGGVDPPILKPDSGDEHTPTPRYIVVDDTYAEVEVVARDIVRAVRAGAGFGDCAVVCRSLEDYGDIVADIFPRFGIPYALRNDLPLMDHPIARLAISLCDLSAGGWRRDTMLDLLDSGFTMLSAPDAARLRRLSAKRGVRHGRERWVTLRGSSEEAERFFAALGQVGDALVSAASLTQFAEALKEALRTIGVRAAVAMAGHVAANASSAAYAALEEAIDLTARLAEEAGASCSAAVFAERLFETCAVSFYPVSGTHADGVSVLEPAQVASRPFRHVYVIGLTEGRFPKPARDNPILDASAAARVGLGGAVRSPSQRAEDETILFQLACDAAIGTLWLSRPRLDSEGTPLIPSSHLAKLNHRVECRDKERSDDITACASTQLAEAVGMCDLAEHLASSWGERLRYRTRMAGDTLKWRERVAQLDPLLAHAGDFPVSREPDRAALGNSASAELAVARSLRVSASELLAALTCPFQAFAHRVLHVREKIEDLTRADDGCVVHETLQRFMNDLRSQKLLAEGEAGRDRAVALLQQMLTNAWRTYVARKPSLDLEEAELGATAWQRAAAGWVDRELAYREANPGYRPELLEVDFGGPSGSHDPLSIRVDGTEFIISGRIDRVDVDPESGDAIIIDYKTGAIPSPKSVNSGDDPQMHVYWRAAQEILDLKPHSAIFDGMKQNKRQEHKFSDAACAEKFNERVDAAATRIVDGDIEVRPRKGACDRCDLIALCRFNSFLMPFDETGPTEDEEDTNGSS